MSGQDQSAAPGGFLGTVERVGNKLPDPAVLFFLLMIAPVIVPRTSSLTSGSSGNEAGPLSVPVFQKPSRCSKFSSLLYTQGASWAGM